MSEKFKKQIRAIRYAKRELQREFNKLERMSFDAINPKSILEVMAEIKEAIAQLEEAGKSLTVMFNLATLIIGE